MTSLHDRALALLAAYDEFVSTTPAEDVILDAIRDLLAENERLKANPPDYVKVITQLVYRAETAEARLRALCEQEPVAWLYQHPVLGDNVQMEDQKPYGIWSQKALIPRPSMEGNANG